MLLERIRADVTAQLGTGYQQPNRNRRAELYQALASALHIEAAETLGGVCTEISTSMEFGRAPVQAQGA